MTALTDIQKALNTIRIITQQEAEAVRLEALALMAGVIADEAKDIEKKREPKIQRNTAQKVKPLPIPQVQQKAPQQTTVQKTKATEPEVSDFKPQQPVPPQ
ncbi:hypothetical protein OAU61_01720 [Planktomarina temperata]|nr:hypothetical protein [Planktomarina temperata]